MYLYRILFNFRGLQIEAKVKGSSMYQVIERFYEKFPESDMEQITRKEVK